MMAFPSSQTAIFRDRFDAGIDLSATPLPHMRSKQGHEINRCRLRGKCPPIGHLVMSLSRLPWQDVADSNNVAYSFHYVLVGHVNRNADDDSGALIVFRRVAVKHKRPLAFQQAS
jgi:hypothetical protein